MMCQFLLHSKVNQLYKYMYLLFFRFFSHIGHYRVLNSVPCPYQLSILYIVMCVCQSQSSNVSLAHPFAFVVKTKQLNSNGNNPLYFLTTVCFLHVRLYFCFVNKYICYSLRNSHVHKCRITLEKNFPSRVDSEISSPMICFPKILLQEQGNYFLSVFFNIEFGDKRKFTL